MKNLFLFLVLIISNQSFAQFFENDLDYLVYDEQGSLIKNLKVKSQIKESYSNTFKGKRALINKEVRKYNKENMLKSFLQEDDQLGKKWNYKYDLYNRLLTGHKEELKTSIKKNRLTGWGLVRSGSKINPDFYEYTYDSLSRIKNIVKCEKKLCEADRYFYLGDTIKIISEDNQGEELGVKYLIETDFYKSKSIYSHCSNLDNKPSSVLSEIKFNKDSLFLTKKHWNNNEISMIEKFFFNEKLKLKKLSKVSKMKTYDRKKILTSTDNILTSTFYYYDKKGRLINKKELNGDYFNIIEFKYNDNGLLREEIRNYKKRNAQENYQTDKHIYSYKFYNN